nr:MAG TPA: hypothetical protein [Caudoviricetes sp.]
MLLRNILHITCVYKRIIRFYSQDQYLQGS